MKRPINLDLLEGEIHLSFGVEYIFSSESPIVFSASDSQQILYHKAIGNGTTEVYFKPWQDTKNDAVWIWNGNSVRKIFQDYNEFVLADHQPDVTPGFINEEYPLFRKLMEYYFRYLGLQFEPSGFIHSLEKFAHIDETFDEFREYMYDEVLHYFPDDVKADKTILAKYISDFYHVRGTEDSIVFLLWVLTQQKPVIDKRRFKVLIASSKEQGKLSDSSVVLQDNYFSQLFSYVLYLRNEDFGEYKDVLYKLVNPDGYLPFGVDLHDPIEIETTSGPIIVTPVET